MRLMFALVSATLFFSLPLHSEVLSSESSFTSLMSEFTTESNYIPNDVVYTLDDGGEKPAKKAAPIEIDCTKGSDQRLKFEKFLTAKYNEMADYLFTMQTQMEEEDVKKGLEREPVKGVPRINSNPNDETARKDGITVYDDCVDVPYVDFLHKLRQYYNWSEMESEMKNTCENAIKFCSYGTKNPYVVAGTLKDDETSLTNDLVACKNIPGGHKQLSSDGIEFASLGLIINNKDCPYYFDIDKTMAALRQQ